jgi:hypothetical protein
MPLKPDSIQPAPVDSAVFDDRKKEVLQETKKLPLGIQAYFAPAVDKIIGYLSRDDRASAKELLMTYPCPTPELESARDILVQLYLK